MKEKRKDQYSLIKIALAIALFLVLSSFVLGYTPLYRGIYNDSYGMPAGHFETTPFPIDENTTTYTIINDEGNHTYYLGTKYYVATNGTDSGGCTNFYDPCLTINYAITQAGSGNKAIIIRNGTYEETSLTLQSGDNDTNRFIITGYGQERPIINGSSTTQDTINAGSNTQYATIQRVKIQDNYRNGIRTGSDDSYINTVDVWLYHNDKWDDSINSTRGDANLYYLGTDNTWIYHTTSEHTDGHGFKVGDDADNAIVEWSIAREAGYWEDYHLTERLSGHPTACDFPNDPGVYGENITIRYTVCGTSLFYAVQLRRLTNFSFHHNEVYDGIHYANVSGTSGRGVGAHQIIINEDSTYGEFHSNIIRSSGPAQNGTGTNAIYVMATNNGAGPINIYNNLIYDNNGAAFRVNNAITNSTINFFSNTVFSNDTGNYDEKANSTIVTQSNVTLTNNIFYQAANKKIIEECLWVGGCSLNHTYNLYYAPSGSVGITLDSTEINADPEWLMIPSGNYTEGFAKLNSTSPAIDNGTDLNVYFNTDFDGLTRPQGSAWDIGAYEYDFPPSIINVSDNLTHGLNISIIGLDFGSKNPAAPLIWDDGENASVDLDNLLTSTSAVKNNGGVGWDYIKPSTESALSSPFPTHARIRYRDIPYRNTPAPHEYSTKYISGAHYQYENNTPAYIGAGENFRDVLVTVDNGAAAPRWYASFYYRLDPLWPDNSPGSLNHKTSVINGGPQAYYGTGYSYLDYRASESPSWSNSSTRFGNMQGNGICDIGTYPGDFAQVNNPRLDWIKYEEVISDDYWGYRGLFIDNVIATQTQTNCPYWFSSQSGDFSNGIQSYTAGGYWRWSINSTFETSSFRGNNNSFRYFDDLYVDTTLSRVVLANNQNYSQATIVEPQIPYAWQNNNINVTVNLGRINTTTAYLYVFDKDDHHNEIGYPVTIIQEETPWCTNTSTVICANSCSYADVSSAVSSASDGDTVMVPGGSCTWSSTLSIPSNKGITLMGAGVDQTNISGSANPRITLNTQLGTRPTSISGFDFRSGGDAVHVYGTGQNWRIHNNKFWAGAFDVNGLTYGVIDNNLFVGDTVQQNGVWGEISGDGGAVDWTVPLALGSQKAVYIENNVFNYTNMNTGTSICDGRGGGRWVIRNNTIFNAPWGSHDAYTNGKRGILSFEFYGNDWSSNSSVGVWTTNYHRGGTGTIFDNTFRARAWNSGSPIYFNDIVTRDSGGAQTPWDADCDNIDELICSDGAGTIYPLSCTINANCVGYGGLCDTVIDGNEDGTGYPCRDQFGTTTDGTGEIVKHPVIVWNNQQCTNNTSPYTNCVPSTTALVGFPGSDANWVKEERDYVDDTSCNDSVDNDGDGDTDMNDTVCQEYWDFTNNKKLGYAAFDYPHPLITGIPGVSLLDPMWNHTTNETIINLTCSVIDNGNLSNITLYANFTSSWVANETRVLTGMYNESVFTKDLSEGSYKWNCYACDTDNNCDWGNINYTLIVEAEPASEILPWSRRINWSPGIPGGIPNRTTICANVTDAPYNATGDGVSDDTAAIQAAIGDCSQDEVLFFPEGTYRTNDTLDVFQKGIVLRGAGPDKTKISHNGSGGVIDFYSWSSSTATNITSGYTKNSTLIVVESTSGFSTGDYVIIDQLINSSLNSKGDCTWCGRDNGTRLMSQIVMITNISGNNITLSRPLYYTFDASLMPEMLKLTTTPVVNGGIEDLYVENLNGSGSNINMQMCINCWIKNVESYYAYSEHVRFSGNYQSEIRDSYFHHGHVYSGGSAYGTLLFKQNSDNLIENNIFYYLRHSMVLEGGGSGNVFGYSYSRRMFGADDPTNTDWLMADISTHGAHPYMNLWEGNDVQHIGPDYTHGSGSHQTYFRNKIIRESQGENNTIDSHLVAADIHTYNYYINVIGNILGLPNCSGVVEEYPYTSSSDPTGSRVWKIGYPWDSATGAVNDTNVNQTLLRHMNWQCADNTIQYDPNTQNTTLPNSYYLDSKPSFFDNVSWPIFDPENQSTFTHKLPAQIRFEAMIAAQNDSYLPNSSNFDGSTTNFSDHNSTSIQNISNLVLEISSYGRIIFNTWVNVSNANLDRDVYIQDKLIGVDSLIEPRLNKTATLTFYNIFYDNPLIYKDGILFTLYNYSLVGNNLSINVSSFSNYSVGISANLSVWDETDNTTKYVNETISFYANYTNITSSALISGASCNVSFNGTWLAMNETATLYEYNYSYDSNGTFTWNVTCRANNFDTLNTSDNVVVNQSGSCTGNFTVINSTHIEACSCNQTAVSAAISNASDGMTVLVPQGECTWSSTLSIPSNKGITLMGAGVDVTNITDGTDGSTNLIEISTDNGYSPVRITGFTFNKINGDAGILVNQGATTKALIIDDNKFFNNTARVIELEDGFGVVSNNTFLMSSQTMRVALMSWDGASSSGDESWNTPTYPGSSQAIYVEDNVFKWIDTSAGYWDSMLDCEGGGRVVLRNNVLNSTKKLNHGAEKASRRRGCRYEEIYSNYFDIYQDHGSLYVPIRVNGGTGTYFDNVFDSQYDDDSIQTYIDRVSVDSGIWGSCNGTGLWDGNFNSSGYPCVDQPGWGEGILFSGFPTASPVAWPNLTLDPLYEWNNTLESGGDINISVHASSTAYISENQEYYNDQTKPGYAAFDYPHPLISGIPGVSLLDPMWNHTTNETIINLTCSVIDNGNLSNITLYADFSGGWAANETVSLSDNYEEVTFNKNLSTGSYKWNCLACDTDNNCDWGNLNYTFKINENISSNNTCEAINASCYYVNKNASGSNNGSDWLDAWEELDQISWASINPGDIIYLAGGDYYTALNIGASGSLGIPLTIKRATTSVHGTNTGWQVSYDSQVVLNSNAYVIINDNSNIVVDGVTNNGFFVSAPNAGLGYPNIVTYGLYLNNINNVLIQNFGVDCANNLYHCRGIHLMYADNITISSSNFNNLVNDGMMISDATNSVFEYNTFGPWLYIPGSCDTTPPDSCHADLLEIRTTQDITFRYNHINWSSDGIHFGILSTSSGRWDIYGNLIYSPVSSFSQAFKMNSVGISAGPIYIYNNVISNYRNPISFDDRVFGEVTNNIFYQDEAVGMGVMNHDYNIYVNSDFITWGATPFVQNTNEIITTIDPFVNGANQDFHLTPFSSAIDSGLDLGSSYNMDLEGNIRPQGNAWDIGAYESNYSSEYILTTLNNPLDSNMTYNKTIVFNCSAISNNDISNITLYTNMSGSWSANETKNISGTSDSTTFTKTLIDGSYAWNCLATNNVSNTSFATSNYSLIINPSYGFNQSSKTININKGSTNSYDLTLLNNNTFAGSLSLNSNSGYVDVPSSIILASYTNTDFTINVSSNTGTLNDVSLTVDITGGNALHQVFLTLISWCGDGNCDSDESCSGCEADCGECSSSPSSYSSSSSSSPTTTTPVLGSTELIQYYFGETHPVMKTETKTSQATTGLFTIINTNPNIPPPPGFVYEIFEVSSGFSSSIIRNTLFTFNVDKSWFDDKDISLEEVSLYLFNTDSEWEEKSTSYVGEGQTTEMYSAETDAIGVFAVAAYIPPPPTPTSSVVTEDEGIGEEIVTEEAKKKFGLTWILIILGSLTILSGVGAGSYFGFKKFKEVRGEKQEELSEEQKRVEIRNFFASEAEMGRKENLSVNLLLQRGYDKTLIRDVYDDYKTEQLVSYVKKLISKGADEKQIVEKLLGVGWSKEKILEILEQANQKTKSDLNVDQVSPEKKP